MEKGSLPPKMEYQGTKVISGKMLADIYDCEPQRIYENLNRNAHRFKADVHYFILENREKDKITAPVQNKLMEGKKMFLWTEKGVFLHAQILNSDRGWEAYEKILSIYFDTKTKN